MKLKSFAFLMAICVFCDAANATLVFTTDASSFPINPGASGVGTVTLSVFDNAVGGSQVFAYDMQLRIQGVGNAVTFAAADQAAGSPFFGTGDFFDSAPGSPINVTDGNGLNPGNVTITSSVSLATFTFNALGSATGTYNIILESINVSYKDGMGNIVPVPGGTLPVAGSVIGTIQAVPEASSFVFGGLAMAICGVVAWRRRSSQPVAAA